MLITINDKERHMLLWESLRGDLMENILEMMTPDMSLET